MQWRVVHLLYSALLYVFLIVKFSIDYYRVFSKVQGSAGYIKVPYSISGAKTVYFICERFYITQYIISIQSIDNINFTLYILPPNKEYTSPYIP